MSLKGVLPCGPLRTERIFEEKSAKPQKVIKLAVERNTQ